MAEDGACNRECDEQLRHIMTVHVRQFTAPKVRGPTCDSLNGSRWLRTHWESSCCTPTAQGASSHPRTLPTEP